MRKIKYSLFVMSLFVSFLSAGNYEEKVVRKFTLQAGGIVELANVNGAIDVTTTGGDTVEIKAVKRSDRKGEIEAVEIVFAQEGKILKVNTKHKRRSVEVEVDFTVVVPEKLARAEFKSVNGGIDCSGKFAELALKTVNGEIDFKGDLRSGEFKTVNGAIAISQESELNGDLTAATVNGAIVIELNRRSAFTIDGRTINGSLANDFGLKIAKRLVGSSFRGKVNNGGHKVKVETVNGSVKISKI